MPATLFDHLAAELGKIEKEGLLKRERAISSPQDAGIHVAGTEGELLNFCANNYLGLANHPPVFQRRHELHLIKVYPQEHLN